jgi:hypothetical protein
MGGLQLALTQQAGSQLGLQDSAAARTDLSKGSSMGSALRGSFARRRPSGTAAASSASFIGSATTGGPIAQWEQAVVLLQVLLPFLVSCGEYLLLQLLAAPAAAGIAIAGFALVEVSASGSSSIRVLNVCFQGLLKCHWLDPTGTNASSTTGCFETIGHLLLLQFASQSALLLCAGVCGRLRNPDAVTLVVAGSQLVIELPL